MIDKQKLNIEGDDNNDDFITREEITEEISQESDEVWVQAIDDIYMEKQQANASRSWVIEDNQDALEEYMNEVSGIALPEDIDSFDW